MLKGISPLLGPELLATLCKMGHGDEIVIADAHFPGHSHNSHVIRADGTRTIDILSALLPLFPLDTYEKCAVTLMAVVDGDSADLRVEEEIRAALSPHLSAPSAINKLARTAFYQRTREASAVIITGEIRKYGCVILKKGVALS